MLAKVHSIRFGVSNPKYYQTTYTSTTCYTYLAHSNSTILTWQNVQPQNTANTFFSCSAFYSFMHKTCGPDELEHVITTNFGAHIIFRFKKCCKFCIQIATVVQLKCFIQINFICPFQALRSMKTK